MGDVFLFQVAPTEQVVDTRIEHYCESLSSAIGLIVVVVEHDEHFFTKIYVVRRPKENISENGFYHYADQIMDGSNVNDYNTIHQDSQQKCLYHWHCKKLVEDL